MKKLLLLLQQAIHCRFKFLSASPLQAWEVSLIHPLTACLAHVVTFILTEFILLWLGTEEIAAVITKHHGLAALVFVDFSPWIHWLGFAPHTTQITDLYLIHMCNTSLCILPFAAKSQWYLNYNHMPEHWWWWCVVKTFIYIILFHFHSGLWLWVKWWIYHYLPSN